MSDTEAAKWEKIQATKEAFREAERLYWAAGAGQSGASLKAHIAEVPQAFQQWLPKDATEQAANLQAYKNFRITTLEPMIRDVSGLGVRISSLPAYEGLVPELGTPPMLAKKIFENAHTQSLNSQKAYEDSLRVRNVKTPAGGMDQGAGRDERPETALVTDGKKLMRIRAKDNADLKRQLEEASSDGFHMVNGTDARKRGLVE